MALIPDDKIAEVRDRTDIVRVISEYVALKRSGQNLVGLCPFHGEKSPSFNVSPTKQFFHCFGCGKSGDVIRFVMDHDGKPFMEVMKDLAQRAGVDLPEPDMSPAARDAQKRSETERAKLVRVMQIACDYFRAQYAASVGDRARAYVEEKRGIGQAVRDGFLLGYAPAGYDGLVRHLETKRVPHELCESAGLIRRRDGARIPAFSAPTKATHFDIFRDRVMCPLQNAQGEVIAFSGRILDAEPEAAPARAPSDGKSDHVPKYINSPETPLYRKGENLYGLHAGKQAIRKSGRAILVEGNFDVLMMHQQGFAETVAPMGTSLTPSQVHLLHRAAPGKVFMFLDGDKAGEKAAARNVGLFLDEELLSYVALLPRGEDPDTFVKNFGGEALEQLLSRGKESVEYFCDYSFNQSGSSIPERVKLLEEEAAPLLRRVKNPTARQRYAERLAMTLDLPPGNVHQLIRSGPAARAVPQQQRASATGNSFAAAMQPVPSQAVSANVNANANGAAAPEPATLDSADVEIIALIADHPRLMQRPASVYRCIENELLRSALKKIGGQTDSVKLNLGDLADALPPSLRAPVNAAALSGRYAAVEDPEKILEAIETRRAEQALRAELKKKVAALRTAVGAAEIEALKTRIGELERSLPSYRRDRAKLGS